MIKSFNIISDKLNRQRPQTRAVLGNCGQRPQRKETAKEGILTNINEKTSKTHRRNAGTQRQTTLTYRHKLKKCFGNIKKNAYLCSRKIKITITKNRRPTGYQGHRNHDNIHYPITHQRRNRRNNRMEITLGKPRQRTGRKRPRKGKKMEYRNRRNTNLGI